MSDLDRWGFEIKGYEGFQKLLGKSPDRLSKALVRGSRRSLASFRRTFIAQTPVAIKGKTGQGSARGRNVGKSFLWEVTPKEGTANKRSIIEGSIYSSSYAAHGLEIGGRVTADGGGMLAIPISKPYGDNVGTSGKIKPTWRYLSRVMAKWRRAYRFFFLKRTGGTLVMAQKRPKRKRGDNSIGPLLADRSFPIFWITQSVDLTPGRLGFFSTWQTYGREVDRRMLEEIDRELRAITRERNNRGR